MSVTLFLRTLPCLIVIAASAPTSLVAFDPRIENSDPVLGLTWCYCPSGNLSVVDGSSLDAYTKTPLPIDGFWLLRTELSQADYHRITEHFSTQFPVSAETLAQRCTEVNGTLPPDQHAPALSNGESTADYPIVGLTLPEAILFCQLASQAHGSHSDQLLVTTIRLPSCAEWQFASRALVSSADSRAPERMHIPTTLPTERNWYSRAATLQFSNLKNSQAGMEHFVETHASLCDAAERLFPTQLAATLRKTTIRDLVQSLMLITKDGKMPPDDKQPLVYVLRVMLRETLYMRDPLGLVEYPARSGALTLPEGPPRTLQFLAKTNRTDAFVNDWGVQDMCGNVSEWCLGWTEPRWSDPAAIPDHPNWLNMSVWDTLPNPSTTDALASLAKLLLKHRKLAENDADAAGLLDAYLCGGSVFDSRWQSYLIWGADKVDDDRLNPNSGKKEFAPNSELNARDHLPGLRLVKVQKLHPQWFQIVRDSASPSRFADRPAPLEWLRQQQTAIASAELPAAEKSRLLNLLGYYQTFHEPSTTETRSAAAESARRLIGAANSASSDYFQLSAQLVRAEPRE